MKGKERKQDEKTRKKQEETEVKSRKKQSRDEKEKKKNDDDRETGSVPIRIGSGRFNIDRRHIQI